MHAQGRLQLILRELREEMQALYGDRLVRLLVYGSHARGDAEQGSDIDVLITLQGAVDPGEEIARASGLLASLSLKHGEVLSCVFVSEERFRNEQSPLLLNVRKEGVAV